MKSPNFLDSPEIHPNYLSTDVDCKTIVKGVKIARQIANCQPLKSRLTGEHAPGPDVGINDDDAMDGEPDDDQVDPQQAETWKTATE